MSDEVFSLPEFIKKIPIDQRPDYIMRKVFEQGAEYICTDFTSFEAHFVKEIMEAIEAVVYAYLLKNVPGGPAFLAQFMATVAGNNLCRSRYITCRVQAKRMSGEMTTSLGNGVTNLILFSFFCDRLNVEFEGVVEGDDGLFRILGGKEGPTKEMYAEAGWTIKLEKVQKLEEASFCGMIFDSDERIIIADARKYLADVGIADPKYFRVKDTKRLELLRARGYSLCYQYPGCPILQELGEALLRSTRGTDLSQMMESRFHTFDTYTRDLIDQAINSVPVHREVMPGTRLLMESKFNISVEEQLDIEDQLRKINSRSQVLGSIDMKLRPDFFPACWHEYYDKYSVLSDRDVSHLSVYGEKDFCESEYAPAA
jgi:hypothetical protein